MKEIWKDIAGYEGLYQISNLGNVKSLARTVVKSNGVIQHRKERLMAKRKSMDGYYIAKLTVNHHSVSVGIHILVAKHFIPNPNHFPEVNHLDCDRTNNCVTNLEWCTHQQNIEHSRLLGHYKGRTGEKNPNFGSTTLRDKYRANPELAKQNNARPKEQNGRSVGVQVSHGEVVKRFPYIGAAAEYLIHEGLTTATVDSIRANITLAIKRGRSYLGCRFEHI